MQLLVAVDRRNFVKSIHHIQPSSCAYRVVSWGKGSKNTPSPCVRSMGMDKSVVINEHDRSCFQLELHLILWVFCHATKCGQCAVEFWQVILGNTVQRSLVVIVVSKGFRIVGHWIEGNGRRPQGELMARGSLFGSVTNRDWHGSEHFIHIRRLSL